MFTVLYFKWITNKDLLLNGTLLSVMWQPGWKGSSGENVYIWQSSFAVHLKLSQHCLLTGYTPIQKFFLKKNKSPSSDLLFLLLITDPTLLAAMFAVHSFLPWDFSIWCWLKGFFPFCQQDH